MWHKAEWKGYPMRLELTPEGLQAKLANLYTTRGALTHIQSAGVVEYTNFISAEG